MESPEFEVCQTFNLPLGAVSETIVPGHDLLFSNGRFGNDLEKSLAKW
jgi:hypothetical protein